MAYGTANVDVIQSSTANTPVQFNDGNGTQVGTLCRAWVSYNGNAQTIRASFNVSSVTYNSSTIYTINFTNALADTSYSAVAMCSGGSSAGANYAYIYNAAAGGTDPTTSTIKITTTLNNPLWTNVAIFR